MGKILIQEIELMLQLGLHPRQQKYFEELLKVAKPVECVSINEVFTQFEIEKIKYIINPAKQQCYKNSHLLVELFPERVKYVEGKVNVFLPIDHAFNRVGDKYVDITFELALSDRDKYEYVSFAEYDIDIIQDLAHETGYYGDYYRTLYMKNVE